MNVYLSFGILKFGVTGLCPLDETLKNEPPFRENPSEVIPHFSPLQLVVRQSSYLIGVLCQGIGDKTIR